jgi:cytochrome c-type biogenesis protein CcmH/NrfF
MTNFVTFKLELDGGNAEMQSNADIAEALAQVSDRVAEGEWDGTVRDVNGNTIGEFHTVMRTSR